jgi:protein-S-isoprenylcysteine O-methyltransferase Ste14
MWGYGLWGAVVVNSLIFIIFALSFTRPRNVRDWRSFGAFSAFIITLFTEMYGFPLTIYLLSGWLGTHFPELNFSHGGGHLWYTLLGMKGDPHTSWIHTVSEVFITGGLIFLGFTWRYLHKAQQNNSVATTGPYKYVRHPQYVAFIAIMIGFLIQWPTILTILMFPVLVRMYLWLSKREEQEAIEQFGDEYVKYAARTPRFIPWLKP